MTKTPLCTVRWPGSFSGGLSLALSLCALSMLGASCRTAEPATVPFSSTAVRLELPFVRQESLHDCGLASISALCRYWDIALPSEERATLARRAAERSGLSGGELVTTLERLGLEVFLFQGSLDRTATGVYAHVDSGRPPLVMLASEGTEAHYEIVLGYDEPRGQLILLDPVQGEVLLPVTSFERDWARCQRFTLLASRGQEVQVASQRQRDQRFDAQPAQ